MKVMASFAIAWTVSGVLNRWKRRHPVVEGSAPVLCGNAVDDPRVQVVQHRGQVGEEDDRDAGRGAELAVGELTPPAETVRVRASL